MTTRDEKAIDDYFIKLTGKAALPKPLEIHYNYGVEIEGSITELNEKDRQDGGRIFTWKFEPVLIKVINKKGEIIKAKDVRKTGQRMRSRAWLFWRNNNLSMSDDDFWDWFGAGAIKNFEEIIDLIREKEKNI